MLGIWLGRHGLWLLRGLARFTWFCLLPALGWLTLCVASFCWWRLPRLLVTFRWVLLAFCLALVGRAAFDETRSSYLQARLFSNLDQAMAFTVAPGPSQTVQFPKNGPHDERLGYAELPDFVASLTARHYAVDSQVQWSPGLARFVNLGAFPVYPEKDQAGLRISDRNGDRLYAAQFPERVYHGFAKIPDVVVRSLLFIEDRYLLDPGQPQRNPAIEWQRFALAAAGRVASLAVPHLREGGGSTLATQIEKFRHSPHGLTGGVGEKLRQMLTASARAYSGGPDTLQHRRAIVTTYLNSTPFSSMPGYGEIIGVPEALRIWFGTDYDTATKILNAAPRTPAELGATISSPIAMRLPSLPTNICGSCPRRGSSIQSCAMPRSTPSCISAPNLRPPARCPTSVRKRPRMSATSWCRC